MSPKTRDLETRREAILRAAFDEFSEKGYERTHLEAIARRARVSKGTLYEVATSKIDLFFLVCARKLAANLNRAIAAITNYDADPMSCLRAAVSAVIPSVREAQGNYAIMYEMFGLALRDENLGRRVAEAMHETIGGLAVAVAEPIRSGIAAGVYRPDLEPREVARFIGAWADYLWREWVLMPEQTTKNLSRQTQIFLDLLERAITIK